MPSLSHYAQITQLPDEAWADHILKLFNQRVTTKQKTLGRDHDQVQELSYMRDELTQQLANLADPTPPSTEFTTTHDQREALIFESYDEAKAAMEILQAKSPVLYFDIVGVDRKFKSEGFALTLPRKRWIKSV